MKTTLLVVLLLAVAVCRHHRRYRADPVDAPGAKAPDAETSTKIEEM
jgi:hypothetical protein